MDVSYHYRALQPNRVGAHCKKQLNMILSLKCQIHKFQFLFFERRDVLFIYNTWHLWNVSVELHSEIRGKPSILQMRPGLKPMPYILASKWKNDLLTLEMFTLTPELDMPWFGKQFHHWYQPVDLHREKFTSGISRSLDLIRHPAGRGCRTSVRHASLCG